LEPGFKVGVSTKFSVGDRLDAGLVVNVGTIRKVGV